MKTINKIWTEREIIERQIGGQVEDLLRRRVWNQVAGRVGGQVWCQVWNQVRNQIREQVEEKIKVFS